MNLIYFFDVPVYRLREEEYYKLREAFIDERMFPKGMPRAEREAFYSRNPDNKMFFQEHLEQAYGGPWKFNEIIGYIRLHLLGTQIRGEWFAPNSKRIVRTRSKVMWMKHWKLAPEKSIPKNSTDAEIFNVILQYLKECQAELPKRYLDLDVFKTLGKNVAWRNVFGWSSP